MRRALLVLLGLCLVPCLGSAQTGDRLRARAEAGDVEAQFELARRHLLGAGDTQEDAAEAFRWFERAAEQGDSRAQMNLGMAYAEGRGVEVDEKLGVEWLLRAAEQGHPRAMAVLGERFWEGRGVVRSRLLAHMWMSRAMAVGSPMARVRAPQMAKDLSDEERVGSRRLGRIQRERIRRRVPDAAP